MRIRNSWMVFFWVGLSWAGLSFFTVACKTENARSTAAPQLSGTPALGSASQISTVATINAEVYLKIERQLQTPADAARTLVGICQVPMGAPRGTVVNCQPQLHGDFSIPEGDLYYSKLHFTSGTADPNQCAYLIFQPYYYRGSATSGFYPTFRHAVPEVPIDCRPLKATADCFNGPAVKLVPDFPKNRGLIFLTNQALELTNTIDSAYQDDQVSNRYSMNTNSNWGASFSDPKDDMGFTSFLGDTAAATCPGACQAPASSASPLGYNAGHQNYAVECRDQYYDLIYGLQVTLDDEDTVTGVDSTLDYYHTWR